MKYLLLFLVFAFPRCMYAAPPCFPGEPTAFEKDLQIMHTTEGCVAYVHCDVGHKWQQFNVVGNWAECKAAEAAMTVATWMSLSHDQMAAAYDAAMAGKTASPEDAALATKAGTVAHPADAPPSGLVTTDTKVYAVSSSTDFNILSPVGTILLGIACDTTQSVTNGGVRYYVVPTKSVTWTGTKRLRVYGKCT